MYHVHICLTVWSQPGDQATTQTCASLQLNLPLSLTAPSQTSTVRACECEKKTDLWHNDVHLTSQFPQRGHELVRVSVDTNPATVDKDLGCAENSDSDTSASTFLIYIYTSVNHVCTFLKAYLDTAHTIMSPNSLSRDNCLCWSKNKMCYSSFKKDQSTQKVKKNADANLTM